MDNSEAKSSRSRHYSPAERAEVVAYVHKFNSEKGRGGQSAASRKFKVSKLTVTLWLKHAAQHGIVDGEADLTGLKLADMVLLHQRIRKTTKEIAKLRAKFDELKESI